MIFGQRLGLRDQRGVACTVDRPAAVGPNDTEDCTRNATASDCFRGRRKGRPHRLIGHAASSSIGLGRIRASSGRTRTDARLSAPDRMKKPS